MTPPLDLQHLKRLAEVAPKIKSFNFEQVNWDDGDKSFELNSDSSFIVIRESDFDKRPYARRFAQFYSAANPQTVLALIAEIERLKDKVADLNDYIRCIEEIK